MARKRYSDDDVLKLLREIDVHLHVGLDVVSSFHRDEMNGVCAVNSFLHFGLSILS